MAQAQSAEAKSAEAKNGKNKGVEEAPAVPEGFTVVESHNIDGWWTPEKGSEVQGRIVGLIEVEDEDKGGFRKVYLVKLDKPSAATMGDEKITLEAGQVIAVGEREKLKEMAYYVRHQGRVFIRCVEKTKLKGTRNMWKFVLAFNGKKGEPVPSERRGSAPVDKGDDIPF